MNKDKLAEWLATSANLLARGGNLDEKRVAVVLMATAGMVMSDNLEDLERIISRIAQGEIGRLTN